MEDNKKTIQQKTIEGGRAYVVISIVGQIISWAFTFWVIRILNPDDYGLMAMAGFIALFIGMFSGLGLGAGIVQREKVTDNDLSSVFWFSIFVGIAFTIIAFFLAYPNSIIFDNPDTIPVTQLVSIMFLITAFATVPQSIMSRNYKFKAIAKVNLWAALISSIVSVFLAKYGFGVYTLVITTLLYQLIRSTGFMYMSNWLPSWHYNFYEVYEFLKFGFILSLGYGFSRFLIHIDTLIVGRLYNVTQLGFYTTGINFSNMPIDKISPLLHPVILPMLSRWQNDKEKSRDAYQNILMYYLMVISPIYIGGMIVADNLVVVILGEKWSEIGFIFKFFCWVNLFKVLSSYHKILLISRGKAKEIFNYDITMFAILVPCVYFSATTGFENIIYTWAIVYPLITITWLVKGVKRCDIGIGEYFSSVATGLAASVVMGLSLLALEMSAIPLLIGNISNIAILFIQIFSGVTVYVLYLFIFQRNLLEKAYKALIKR